MSKKFKEVTQDEFRLRNVPDWANYLAVDRSGFWKSDLWAYGEMPTIDANGIFRAPTSMQICVGSFGTKYAHTPEPIKRQTFKQLTADTFKLSEIPDWVQWLEVDTSGNLWGYEFAPTWHESIGRFLNSSFESRFAGQLGEGYEPFVKLIKRPEQ